MKNPLFQLILSGLALGLMGGSVAIHSLHVSNTKEYAENQQWLATGSALPGEPGSNIATTELVRLRGATGVRSANPASKRETTATVEALEAIVARLQELKTENENLHGQLEETNRDLVEMQFRIDTHSEAFRPMPISSGSLLDGSFSPGDASHPLLPPK